MVAASVRVLVFFFCYPGRYVIMCLYSSWLDYLQLMVMGIEITAVRIWLDMSDIDKLLQVVIERED